MKAHLQLLEDLHATVVDGRPTTDTWKNHLSPGFAEWRKGLDGSMNIPRMARAIQAALEPTAAADWWHRLLESEQEARETEDRLFRWCGWECFSAYYWGWIWLAEACALRFLSGGASGEREEASSPALERLQRALELHAILFTLVAVPEMVVRGRRDQVRFRGPGTLGAGLRGAPIQSRIRDVNTLGTRAIGSPAEPDLIKGTVRETADRIGDWGVEPKLAETCRDFLAGPRPERSAAAFLVERLGDLRTVVPYHVRRYDDSTVVTWIERNASGNTSAIWYARQGPGPEQITRLFPYSQQRVRGGHPELGRGIGQLEGTASKERVVVSNLTAEEAERRGVDRVVLSAELPDGRPRFELRLESEAPPLAHWQGEHLEVGKP